MIAGPYKAGAPTVEAQAANLRTLNTAAVASQGADDEVRLFDAAGKPVYRALDQVPRA